MRQAVAVMPLAAKVLKKVIVNTGGNKRQVPAKRQNRGSRNIRINKALWVIAEQFRKWKS
ncbi:hypothetical protein V5O77_25630 [Escherichia coli]|uniref:hypothetical protein n=1 Tax=Escherichia coli TaxID=562 RepID=UPI003FA2B6F2